MKKQIVAIMMTVVFFLTAIVPSAQAFAEEGKETPKTQATLSLEKQAEGRYKDDDQLTVLIALNDAKMKELHGLEAVPVANRKGKAHLEEQVAYAKAAQNVFLEACRKADLSCEVQETYDVAFSGLAIETTLRDAKRMAAFPEVAAAEISVTYAAPILSPVHIIKPFDTSSNEMVEANKAWLNEFSGKGQFIAIIDSGGDPNHPSFAEIDAEEAAYPNEGSILRAIKKGGTSKGQFFSTKIPFGFNYVGKNTKIKENNPSSHGMHVAGIVGANGTDLKGVAPDAQLAIMRVFGEGFISGTTPKIYNKAVDDAVKLGVDSINMSFGSPSGSESAVAPVTVRALQDAQAMGIVVSIAAGNDAFFGNGISLNPDATNPDYGLLGDPAVVPISMAVASVENIYVANKAVRVDRDPNKEIAYQATNVGTLSSEFVAFVEVGYGYPEDFKDQSLKGKYALISRGNKEGQGGFNFIDKINNAAAAGAIGAIIYDNENSPSLINMAVEGTTIPSAFISKADGDYLKAHPDYKIRFDTEYVFGENQNGGALSEFSSWGLSPEGNLKPDIAAPGGKIYSTLNDGGYGVMSGTSMAAPHVAGGIAIVKQRVERTWPGLQGDEKHRLIKNLLMSTAVPHKNSETNAFTSPRQQGAGLMKLERAIQTPVVFEGTNGISSYNAGNIEDNKVSIQASLRNLSDQPKTYRLYGVLNTDTVEDGKILLKPRYLMQSPVQSVTVPAGASQTFTVEMAIPDAEQLSEAMPNGYFLEGYIFAEGEDTPEISMPFVGFKGSFGDLNVLEKSIYQLTAEGKRPFYYEQSDASNNYFTHLATAVDKKMTVLGQGVDSTKENPQYDASKIAFSPDGDRNADEVRFLGVFLRNYKGFSLQVYPEGKENPEDLIYEKKSPGDYGLKNFYVADPTHPTHNMITHKMHWVWDGTKQDGSAASEGKYVMHIKSAVNSPNAKEQTMKFPIQLDNTHPRLVRAGYDQNKRIFEVQEIEETGSGVRDVYLRNGDKIIRSADRKTFQLSAEDDLEKVLVVILDEAHNKVEMPLNQAIRPDKGRSILVSGRTADGLYVPSDQFTWEVKSPEGKDEDPYNLSVGKHVLVITSTKGEYELDAGSPPLEMPFEITEKDMQKRIVVPFKSMYLYDVYVGLNNPHKLKIKFSLENVKTGAQYPVKELNPGNDSQSIAKVPSGTYKLHIEGVESGYYATFEGTNVVGNQVTVKANSFSGTFTSVKITKPQQKDVRVEVERNGYEGPLTVAFKAKDFFETVHSAEIPAGSSEAMITLPKLPFEVSLKEIADADYGFEAFSWKIGLKKNPVAKITLQKNETPDVNKDALKEAITSAEKLQEKEYTADTWAPFAAALAEAKTVLENKNATQKDVDAALQKLQNALKALKKEETPDVNKDALKEAITSAEKLQEKEYTADTWAPFAAALAEAKTVLENKNATQKDVDEALQKLQTTLKALKKEETPVPEVNKTELASEIKKADEIDRSLYEAQSLAQLDQVLNAAKEIFADQDASQEAVDNACSALTKALAALKPKEDNEKEKAKEALKTALEAAQALLETEYTPDSWRSFATVCTETEQMIKDADATAEDFKTQLTKLQAAQAALIKAGTEEPISDQKAHLIMLLQAVKGLQEGDYETASWEAFTVAHQNAEEALNKATATESEWQEAVDALKAALTGLKTKDGEPAIEWTTAEMVEKAITQLIDPTLEDEKTVEAIRICYDALTEDEKAHVSNLNVLEAAEKTLLNLKNQKATENVQNLIDALPTVDALTLKDEASVVAARAAYDALSDAQKELVSAAASEKLAAVEKQLKKLKKAVPQPTPGGGGGSAVIPKPKPVDEIEKKSEKDEKPKTDVSEPSVDEKKQKVKLVGYPDGTFRPDQPLSRAEIVAILARLIGGQAQGDQSFADVAHQDWYASSAYLLKEKQIIVGYEGNLFAGSREVSRAEFVAMLVKWRGISGEGHDFDDVSKMHWAYRAISAATKAGWIVGVDEHNFAPEKSLTRAEAVVILNRLLENKTEVSLSTTQFSDVPSSHWAYADIMTIV